jgi:Ca-activated chloride channel family protein
MLSPAVSMAIMRIEQVTLSCLRSLSTFCLRVLAVPTVIVLTLTLSGSAQTTDTVDTVRVDSDLVNLQVSVICHDRSKPPSALQPLQQRDFLVFDEGTPQEIAFFEAADAPFDLILLLDLSGSTSDKLKLIRKSSRRFVDAARPLDRIAILTFTDKVQIISRLTSDHAALRKSIDDIEKPGGGTNFWDALRFVLETVARTSQGERRSAVVVMTDGIDNALPDVAGEGSRTTFAELLDFAQRSEAVIFPVYLDTEKEEVKLHRSTPASYVTARGQLAQLADASGTEVHRANKLTDLESIYEQIIRDLGKVYSIGYQPLNKDRDGKWHKVSVSLVNHADLAARTRSGYYSNRLPSSLPPWLP